MDKKYNVQLIEDERFTPEEKELVYNYVKKINESEGESFKESIESHRLKCCYIFRAEYNRGVFNVIEEEDCIIMQASFERDVDDYNIIKVMSQVIKDAISREGHKEIYLNVYGYNTILINYFRNYGFHQCPYGYGVEMSIKKEEADIQALMSFTMNEELEFRKFEQEHWREYLDLLEDAFMEQAIQCNEKVTIDDTEIEWLKGINSRGDFGALWRNNQLIGLYLVDGNSIDHIAILSKFKGRGYGTIILKYCMKELFIKRKCKEINLCTYKINYKAQKLYIKNGFRITSFYSFNEYR